MYFADLPEKFGLYSNDDDISITVKTVDIFFQLIQ